MTEISTKEAEILAWRSLPQKDQFVLLFFTRLADIFQALSIQAYLFYYVKNLDTSASDSTISSRAGLLMGSLTGAQLLTTLFWARIADLRWIGRKGVILVGLFGTGLSCLLFGFSRSFEMALACRLIGGALNAIPSMVGVMTSEIVEEKRLLPFAFLLHPMSFGVASTLGPAIGGLTADPASHHEELFGPNSLFGGEEGVQWMIKYPFALPNTLSAGLLLSVGVYAVFRLKETLRPQDRVPDTELNVLGAGEFRRDLPFPDEKFEVDPLSESIWNSKFIFTLLALASFDFHTAAFNTILPLFLSTPPTRPSALENHSLPFIFSGGLAMSPSSVGIVTALMGAIGLILQVTIYPRIHHQLGTIGCNRQFSSFFIVTYALMPYAAFCWSYDDDAGIKAWAVVILLLLLHGLGRTFVLPTSAVLLNDCSKAPTDLTRVHGIGQVVNAASRTLGGALGGYWYGFGIEHGVVGVAWWAVSLTALLGWLSSRRISQ